MIKECLLLKIPQICPLDVSIKEFGKLRSHFTREKNNCFKLNNLKGVSVFVKEDEDFKYLCVKLED